VADLGMRIHRMRMLLRSEESCKKDGDGQYHPKEFHSAAAPATAPMPAEASSDDTLPVRLHIIIRR
jgi:hypothetical protein